MAHNEMALMKGRNLCLEMNKKETKEFVIKFQRVPCSANVATHKGNRHLSRESPRYRQRSSLFPLTPRAER